MAINKTLWQFAQGDDRVLLAHGHRHRQDLHGLPAGLEAAERQGPQARTRSLPHRPQQPQGPGLPRLLRLLGRRARADRQGDGRQGPAPGRQDLLRQLPEPRRGTRRQEGLRALRPGLLRSGRHRRMPPLRIRRLVRRSGALRRRAPARPDRHAARTRRRRPRADRRREAPRHASTTSATPSTPTASSRPSKTATSCPTCWKSGSPTSTRTASPAPTASATRRPISSATSACPTAPRPSPKTSGTFSASTSLRDEKTIVFCVDDTHAAFMAQELRRLSGDNDYAARITRAERNSHQLERNFAVVGPSKPRVAVTVDLLTTGFDAPDVKNIVFVRPLRSAILYKQMKGRGTRLCEDINKRYFTIFDYSGASHWRTPSSTATRPTGRRAHAKKAKPTEESRANRTQAGRRRRLGRHLGDEPLRLPGRRPQDSVRGIHRAVARVHPRRQPQEPGRAAAHLDRQEEPPGTARGPARPRHLPVRVPPLPRPAGYRRRRHPGQDRLPAAARAHPRTTASNRLLGPKTRSGCLTSVGETATCAEDADRFKTPRSGRPRSTTTACSASTIWSRPAPTARRSLPSSSAASAR